VGRQPRAMAAHVAAEPSDPLGLEHLASAPPRIRGAHRAARLCRSRRSSPAPAARGGKADPPADARLRQAGAERLDRLSVGLLNAAGQGGRVAQRESTPFTRVGSQVQSLSRPPHFPTTYGTPANLSKLDSTDFPRAENENIVKWSFPHVADGHSR
jgi:hypothetical protein